MIRLESPAIVQIEDRIALFIDMEATTLSRGGDRRPIERSEGRDLSYTSLFMQTMCEDTSKAGAKFNEERQWRRQWRPSSASPLIAKHVDEIRAMRNQA